ncbi:uncharacterized protein BO80DRAFT_425018 [Aspergillus ibericus CBS 121593]|uniref:PH domain-containing protein n=1 Tax=Aspergillus ibericus CBS 121593 TaxID=1448316 RepID=A0A395GZQ4_9EURO|nr:hypothetical protein BO80DRAFT_425018 [Aspergillus ibericus CBS 121593]RAL01036.1 hypothetical protein BO80DRAFT_425018 [Aspergillus ibericus CBS 121593]
MSEAPKPVEETPAAAPAVAPVTEAPAATETPATETAAVEAPQETPAETTEAAPAAAEESKADAPAEEPKEEAKQEEVTPASEGVLGYKAPGLVKGLRFAKRFFYFSDDAVEAKQLSAFHQNEKAAVANPIAAWASQTGKGLLFFTKRAEDKATPTGIFNLAEVSDIAKEGSVELHFKVNGQKHTFQAANATERDSWIAALEAKSAEAKAEKEAVTSSEGYKAELEKLSPAAAEPAKKAEPKEEAAPAEDKKEEKATSKSRSQSRKRASIFGTLLGKKEEAKEEAAPAEDKEDKAEEAKPAEAAAEAPAEASAAAESAEPAAAVPAEASDKKEEKEEKKEDKEEKKAEHKSKRASLFGNFFQKVTSPSHEKSEKEATAPAETPVASTAPQLDNPVEEAAVKPIEPESVTAPAEAEAAKDATPAQSPVAETPKDKRRTSFFGNFGKKKGDSDNEGADGEPKPKGNKLGGIFRKPSKAVKPEVKDTEAEAKAEAPKEATVPESPAEEAAQPAEAAEEESKPVNVASTSTPVQAAA